MPLAQLRFSALLFAALPALFTFTVDVESHPGGGGAAAQTHRLLECPRGSTPPLNVTAGQLTAED